jgi:hypothetical protein
MRTDTQRLDWLANHLLGGHGVHAYQSTAGPQFKMASKHVYVLHSARINYSETIRSAIDDAMAKENNSSTN